MPTYLVSQDLGEAGFPGWGCGWWRPNFENIECSARSKVRKNKSSIFGAWVGIGLDGRRAAGSSKA